MGSHLIVDVNSKIGEDTKGMNIGKINSLTSLRFFAIMTVAVQHLRELIGWTPKSGWATLGVTLFFVLSGFLLTINYKKILTRQDAVKFLWRRFARLYPLYLATFFLSFAVIYFRNLWSGTGYVSTMANLLLLQSWFSSINIHFAYNAAGWAISTLFFFYIAFVFIQFDFRKNFLIMFFLSIISLIISVIYIIDNNSDWFQIHWLLHMLPTNRIMAFLLGMALAKLFMSMFDKLKNLNNFYASCIELLLIVFILDRLSFCMVLNALVPLISINFNIPQLLTRQLIDVYLLTPLLSGLFIFICGLENGLISRFFDKKPLIFLGELSFSIYLSHQIVFRLLALFDNVNDIILVLIASGITLILSYFLYKFIEIPCSQYLRQYFQYQKNS